MDICLFRWGSRFSEGFTNTHPFMSTGCKPTKNMDHRYLTRFWFVGILMGTNWIIALITLLSEVRVKTEWIALHYWVQIKCRNTKEGFLMKLQHKLERIGRLD